MSDPRSSASGEGSFPPGRRLTATSFHLVTIRFSGPAIRDPRARTGLPSVPRLVTVGSRNFNNPAAYADASTTWQCTDLASRMVGTTPLPETSAADLDGNLTRHAIKTQWDSTIPVGRGERVGSDLHPVLNGILGGWQFNGVGRIQARTINFGNVRLVGMTVDELTDVYRHDVRLDPETGLQTVFMLPQDIIDNTRRAFNVSTTSATGYSALGVPEGRSFAPANSADCLQLKAGDCAPRTLLVRAPFQLHARRCRVQ